MTSRAKKKTLQEKSTRKSPQNKALPSNSAGNKIFHPPENFLDHRQLRSHMGGGTGTNPSGHNNGVIGGSTSSMNGSFNLNFYNNNATYSRFGPNILPQFHITTAVPPPIQMPIHQMPHTSDNMNYSNNIPIRKHLVCTECNECFKSDKDLKDHSQVHATAGGNNSNNTINTTTDNSCPICRKRLRRSENLKRHMMTHEDYKPFPCNSTGCHKSFKQASHLKAHMSVHTGNEVLMCPMCSKYFQHAKNFKRHMLIHEGIKPHACEVCGKQFRQAVHLKSHMNIHNGGVKPFNCHICSKHFSRVDNLRRHVTNVHDGIKNYSCDQCNKQYTQAHHLKSHSVKCMKDSQDRIIR